MPKRSVVAMALPFALVASSAHAEPPEVFPAPGVYLQAEWVRCRDVDTLEWRVPGSAFIFASRLIGVWGPELQGGTPELQAIAVRGKVFAIEQCQRANPFRVYIPLPSGPQPLKSLTFDRIPSYVYLDDTTTLNRIVVENGFASSKRNGKLGE